MAEEKATNTIQMVAEDITFDDVLVDNAAVKSIKPVPGSIVTRSIHRKKVKKQKPKKLKKPVPERIFITGTTSWKHLPPINKILKQIDNKDFVITGTSRGVEQLTVQSCKHLGIPIIQIHPWHHLPNSEHIKNSYIVNLLKPTLILIFDKSGETEHYSLYKLAKRKDIPLRVISK
jgi:hypothetical protein